MNRTVGVRLATATAVLATIGLMSGCGPGPAEPSAAPAAVPASPAAPVCSSAATTDTTGSPLPATYADAARQIADAACRHDYTALTGLMDDRFTDDTHGSASPVTIVAGWRADDPSGQNLDTLAALLAQQPTQDQGGLTFTRGGATATFARMPLSHPWTGFTRGSSATAPSTSASAAPASSCPDAADLVDAWNANPPPGDPAASGASHVLCSGSWAGAQIDAGGNAYSGLFRRSGSGWSRVDLGPACSGGEVPAKLRVVCTSN